MGDRGSRKGHLARTWGLSSDEPVIHWHRPWGFSRGRCGKSSWCRAPDLGLRVRVGLNGQEASQHPGLRVDGGRTMIYVGDSEEASGELYWA